MAVLATVAASAGIGSTAMRIEIAGALASGKTTLAGLLGSMGWHVVYEDLSTNPYLELRKVDPEKYELLCQQRFAEDKINGIAAAVAAGKDMIVSDYSLVVERAYLSHYLKDRPDWIAAIERRLHESGPLIGPLDAIIHLRCPAEVQLDRIRTRGRSFEQGHDVAFLNSINRLVDDRVADAQSSGIRVIDVEAPALAGPESASALANVLTQIGVPLPSFAA